MEKIFSFFKKNMVIIVLIILVVLMLCKPKRKKVKEGFSDIPPPPAKECKGYDCTIPGQICPKGVPGASGMNYLCQENDKGERKWKPCKAFDFTNDCTPITKNGNGLCSNGIGGEVQSGFTKEECMKLDRNKKIYDDGNGTVIPDYEKEKLVYKEETDINNFYSENIKKNCKPWIDDRSKVDLNEECLGAIWTGTGCNPSATYGGEWSKTKNFNEMYLDYNYWRAKGCGDKGINHQSTKQINSAEEQINKSLELSLNTVNKNNLNAKGPGVGPIQKKVIERLKNIKNKIIDKTTVETELKEGFSSGSGIIQNTFEQTKKYNNFNLYLLEIVKGYNEALINGTSKEDARDVLVNTYNDFKNDGTVSSIIGAQNTDAFEKAILDYTGVNVNVLAPAPGSSTEPFDNGVSYDENGNLREHHQRGMSCYLITALTKAKLLSIGQVYQLRKLMLEAFKVETNRPFFHFYYDNFGKIADMLVKENKLSEILPNMLKCIDLSKNGQFDLAFEQYSLTARQAYQICKDMGMDTKDLEDKFEQLDGTISQLPEPNSLFVENGFIEALKSC